MIDHSGRTPVESVPEFHQFLALWFEISCLTYVRKFQGSGFAVRPRGGPTSDTLGGRTLETIQFAV